MMKPVLALLASTAVVLQPAMAAALPPAADGATATPPFPTPAPYAPSGMGIKSFNGQPGLSYSDAFNPTNGVPTPRVVPITPYNAPFAIRRTGDSMPAALLGFTFNGAPTIASLQQVLADVGLFYAKGGLADGNSHPLSSITSFNGINTTGYTLAQWQALFAQQVNSVTHVNPVTALTNEADEVAIQAMINYTQDNSPSNEQKINLPSGLVRLTRPVISGCKPITVKGAGIYSTKLYQTGFLQDGWHHGLADSGCEAGYGQLFAMQDLSFGASNFGGKMLSIEHNSQSTGLTFANIYQQGGGANGPDHFHDGIWCVGCSGATFYNVNLNGVASAYGTVGVGLFLGGDGVGAITWLMGTIGGYDYCVESFTGAQGPQPSAGGTGGDVEGIVFDDINAGGCGRAVFKLQYGGYGPGNTAQYYVLNSQFGRLTQAFIDADYSAEVKIENNLTYAAGLNTTATANISTGNQTLTLQGSGTNGLPQVGDEILDVYSLFPVGTTVTGVSGGSVTVSQAPTSGGTEVVSFRHVYPFTGSVAGALISNVSTYGDQVVIGGHVNGGGFPVGATIAAVDAAHHTVTMSMPAASAYSGPMSFGYPPPGTFVRYNHTQDLTLRNNTWLFGPGHNISTIGDFANGINTTIKDTQIWDYGPALQRVWLDSGGNQTLRETNTQTPVSQVGTVPVTQPLISGTNARWESYFTSIGCDVLSTGSVQCQGSTIVTLSATADAPIALPPAYINTPQINAENGDVGAFGSFCSPKGATTAVSFTVGCPAGSKGAVARVNWSSYGK